MKRKKQKQTIPFFRRRYTIEGAVPERLYKQLREKRLFTSDVKQSGDVITLDISILNAKALERLCKENGYSITRVTDGDAVKALRRIKHRPALLITLC